VCGGQTPDTRHKIPERLLTIKEMITMEKIIGMLITIGILLAPIVILIAFLYIFWYGGLLFDWIWNNLFGLIDLLEILILETSYYSSGYSQESTYQGFSSNQAHRREDYYHDFDFNQLGYKEACLVSEDPKGYYKILEVDYNADHKEILIAYHRMAKKYHPDIHPENEDYANEMMKKINLAKEVLTDPIKRAEYDYEWK